MKQVKYLLGGKKEFSTCGQTHEWAQRESHTSWQFESLICGISSRFPPASHLDLPGSKSVFGISQDLPTCVHASLSQDGFY